MTITIPYRQLSLSRCQLSCRIRAAALLFGCLLPLATCKADLVVYPQEVITVSYQGSLNYALSRQITQTMDEMRVAQLAELRDTLQRQNHSLTQPMVAIAQLSQVAEETTAYRTRLSTTQR